MRYAAGRLALLVPTIVAVTAIVFVLIRLVPGDVVTLLVNDHSVTPQAARRLRHDLGLDAPIPVQFARYLSGAARGDLGRSIWSGRNVTTELRDRVPVTAELASLAAAFSLLLGVPLGALAAIKQDRRLDYLIRTLAIAGLSLPGFWLGTLAIVFPARWWHYVPPLRYVSPIANPLANLREFVVPALIMSLGLGAVLMRMTRALLLDVLHEDYMRTARAKGLPERTVIWRHGLRNSCIPIVTLFGTQLAVLLGGTVVFEQIFNLKGVGTYAFQAVTMRDYPAIQAVNLFLALAVLLVNFVIDLSYGMLDPRVRTGG